MASVRAASALAALLAAGAAPAGAQPAPGGVPGPSFLVWLKANAGTDTTTDNAPVQFWTDQSGSGNHARQTISTFSRPLFRSDTANLINFNPALSFDSNNDYLRVSLNVNPFVRDPLSTAIVYRPTVGGGLYGNDDTGWDLAHDTTYVTGNDNNVSYAGGDTPGLPVINGGFFDHGAVAGSSVYINNRQAVAFTYANVTSTYDFLDIGVTGTPCTPCGTFFGGTIGEFILYSRQLTPQERQRVDSYLAIKYGITLNQTTPTNYLDSGAAVIWNAVGNATYRNNITGIGRDDASALTQKQSRSVQAGSLVTMGLGTIAVDNVSNPAAFAADRSFLVWGNDNGSTSFATPVTPPAGLAGGTRMGRIWKVQATGSVGTVKLGVPTTLSSGNTVYAVVSNDAVFEAGDQWLPLSSFTAGASYLATDVTFANGQFFTFATVVAAPGGVRAGLGLWLRADRGTSTTSNGTGVSQWLDQSGAGNDGFQSSVSQQPAFRSDLASLINFNPVLRFDAVDDWVQVNLDVNPAALDPLSVAMVHKTTGGGGGLYGNENGSFDLGHFSSGVAANDTFVNYAGGGIGPPVINGAQYDHGSFNGSSVFINDRRVLTFTYANSLGSNDYLSIGVNGTPCFLCEDFFSGTVSEYILYGRTLILDERQRIDSYLAIKYGITLDQTTPTGYLDSGSAVIWSAVVNAGYRNAITGIGRDDASALHQKQSRSVNTDSLVTIGLGTIAVDNLSHPGGFATDRTFLVWGNDAGDTAISTPVTPPARLSGGLRMGRVWKVQETGTVPTVRVGVPAATGGADPLYLVVSSDAAFDAADQWIAMAPSAAGATGYRAADADFTTGQFFTFATAVPADFGDGPASYGTLLANDGARHAVPGFNAVAGTAPLMLGARIDVEPDGQPGATANGDDALDIDDEDGVALPALVAGQTANAAVTVTNSGAAAVLNAWADWNGNGSFADAGERFATNRAVSSGVNVVPVPVPTGTSGLVVFRFRLSTQAGFSPTGLLPDGEVEDHAATVVRQTDLAITKTDGQLAYVPGAAITYTLTVTNAGPSTATGVSIADAVPAAITGLTLGCTASGIASCGTNGTSGNSVSFTNASLAPGAGHALTITISGTVAPNTTGPVVNTASVAAGTGQTDPVSANNSATDTDAQGAGVANLAIAKTDGRSSYVAGTPITYTVTVTNAGPSSAAPLSVTDAVPATITGVTASCTAAGTASCGANTSAGNSVAFTGASLAAGAGHSLTITISGTIGPGTTGDLINTAQVTVPAGAPYGDPILGNNAATDVDTAGTPQVDLAITKTDGQASYVPGAPLTYTLRVTNAGPSTATGFSVADAVPAALTGVAVACVVEGLASCGTNTSTGNSVSLTNASVAPGGANGLAITVTGTVAPGTTGPLANTGTVTAGPGTAEANLANNSATDTTLQGAGLADLAISKTNQQSSYVAGTPVTYTLTVTNTGPSHAPAFDLSDEVPAAILGVTASCVPTGTATCGTNGSAGNTVSFVGASLDAGAGNLLTITISGTIRTDATGSLANTAQVSIPAGAGYSDPVPGNNTATDTDTALPQQVDLAIAKTDSQTSYVPGAPIRYTVTVTNAGPSAATDVRVSDTLPAAIGNVTARCVASGLALCGTTSVTGNVVSLSNASIPPPGATHRLTITIDGKVSPDTTGTLVNTATVTAAAGATETALANNTATDTDTQGAGVADLRVTKTDGAATYTPGAAITYQIVVVNDGPSHAPGFDIDDVVPAAISGVGISCAVTNGSGTCGTNDTAGNAIAFSGATLAAGGALTLAVTGTIEPGATGDLVNTVEATVPAGNGFTDPDPADNTATDLDTAGTQVIDLAITKSNGQTTYVPGTPIVYTLTVSNAGPSTASDVTVTDEVPAAITDVRVTCAATGAASCGSQSTQGRLQRTAGASVPPGETLTITISGTVAPDATGDLVNTATVAASGGATDTDPTNNSATDTDTQAAPQVDLAVTKDDGATTYVPGTPIGYTITVTNAGPSTATGIGLADPVPAAITAVTVACSVTGTGSCGTDTSAGNAVSFTDMSVAPGADHALTVTVSGTVSPAAAGPVANTATVTAGAGSTEANLANNGATDTDTPGTSLVDLAIAKTDGRTSYVPGTPIRYTVTVSNAGPSSANGFSVADLVPPAITGVTVLCTVTGTGSCGTNGTSGSSVSFTNASLAAGAGHALTLTIDGTIRPGATGLLGNMATVTPGAGSTDTNAANNSATDTDTPGTSQVDLAITKTDGRVNYVPGTAITYTITVTNAGPSTAIGVSITDTVPSSIAGVTVTCAVIGTGSCGTDGSLGNLVSFTNAALSPGAGHALTLTVSGTIAPSTDGQLANTATVSPGAGSVDLNTANNSATDADSPGPSQVDLSVTKSDGRTTYVPGSPISYTITVTNAGPSSAGGFSISDPVPAAITGVTATCVIAGNGSCGTNGSAGNTVSFTDANLTPGAGQALTITVTGTIRPDATGDLVNTATVTAGTGSTEASTGNNSATDTDTQGTSQVDLAIAKTDGQATYVPGTPISYTITVTNAGPSTANGFSIADTVPAAITGVTVSCVVTGTGSCGTNASSGNGVGFTNASLAPGAGHTLTITVSGTISPSASGALVNTATVTAGAGSTDTSPGNNSATDTDTLGGTEADLAITKTDGQATYVPGTPITYTIAVTNAGPSDAAGFTITDAVPGAITGVTATCAVTGTGSCGTNGSSGNAVSFTNGSLAPGAGHVLTITIAGTVSASASGPLANSATIAPGAGSTDASPGNNSATDTDAPGTAQADLGITKTGSASVLPGGSVTYTLTVTNDGPSDAPAVIVNDPTPAGLTFASNTGDCTTAFPCALGTVPAHATRTITATFGVPSGYTAPAPIVNAANVSSAASDPNAANDSATVGTALIRDADVAVTKSAPADVVAGETIDITVSVLSRGPNHATGVEVTDVLPAGFAFVAAAPTQGVYDETTGLWTVGALPVSSSAQLVITATATEPGPITNVAVKTGQNEPDPDTSNDSSGTTTNVAAAAELAVEKSVDRPEALVGETVTFTVHATNRGPNGATGVAITDTLTPGLTIVSATPSQGAFGGGVWTVGALDVSAQATLTIVAQIDAPGALVNNAEVTAQDQLDPDPLNNSDAASVNAAPAADLRVRKAVSDPAPGVGAQTTYTVAVTNLGPSAVTSAAILDVLPANVAFVSSTASQGSYDAGTGVWTVGGLAVTSTATLSITVRVTALGSAANTATRQSSAPVDPNPANDGDSSSAAPALIADLAIAKTLMTAPIPGLPATYTIVVVNNGPSPVTGATATDVFPGALLGVAWTCAADPGSACTPSGTGNLAAALDLEAGDRATFTVTGTLASGVTGLLTNTATVAVPAGVTDGDPTNDASTSTATLTPLADMQVTKTGPAQATAGTNVTYGITVTNAGPSDATGVALNDVTPPGLTLVSVSGDCAGGFPCALEPAFVAGGPPRTVSVTFAVPAGYTTPDPIANTATVSSATADPAAGNNAATATTSLAAPVTDLAIAKTNGVTTLVPGATTTYTITVTNAGPTDAVGATVTDTFPAALTGVTWTCAGTGGGVCAPAGSGHIAERVTVPVGGAVTFTATGTIAPDAVGVLVNTAGVAPPPGASDPSSTNNTDSDTLTPRADLAIAKTGPASVVPGTNVVYTLTVTNTGPSNAEGVVVTDPTPAGLTWVSTTGDCTTAFPCALGTLLAGGPPRTITATFAVPPAYTTPAPITNRATVAAATPDPVSANDSATAQTPLDRNADVEIRKTAPAAVLVGDAVELTITATNLGPAAASGVEVTDVLPAGFQFVSAAPTQGAYDAATGRWAVGALAVGPVARLVITATATSAGAITNLAAKTGQNQPDPNPNNDTAGATTSAAPAADIMVAKDVDRADPLVGETVTFTVRATNRGPSAATGVTIADALPAGLALVGATPSQGTYAGGVWTVGSLAVAAEATLTLVARVDAPGALANDAAVTAQDQADPDPLNNRDAASVNAAPAADLRVTKAVSDAAPAVGGLTTYTIAVTNLGPSAAVSATIGDVLPASVTFVSATASQGTYDPVTGAWTVGALPATVTQTLSITVRVTALGAVINTATRQASSPVDPNPLNDGASVTATPQLVADLAITKTPSTAAVAAGAPLTWTLVVTNAGPSEAAGATVTDNFPLAFTGATWTCTATAGSTCGQASGAGAIDAPVTIAAGGRATFVATTIVAAAASGPQANAASVAPPAGTVDPAPADNGDTRVVLVTGAADLAITKTGPASVVPGANVVYTITVTNAGPSNAASVVVTDPTPAGLTWVSTTGDCVTAFPCDLGTIEAGAPRTVTATFAVPATYTAPDPMANTATVAGSTPDPLPANNAATVETTLDRNVDLQVTKTGPASAVPGTSIAYTITVTNAGTSDALGVVVDDATPSGLTWVSNTGDCTAAFPCALGALPAGATRTITATFAIPRGHTTPDPVVNTATVSSATPDSVPANDTASASTALSPAADIALAKTVDRPAAAPGETVVFTLTAANRGPSASSGVQVLDALAAGLSLDAAVPSQGTYDAMSGVWTIGPLADGASATLTITAHLTRPGPLVNTAVRLVSDQVDPDGSNDAAGAAITTLPVADVRIRTTADAAASPPGGIVTFSVSAFNDGPDDATGLRVVDLLPAGLAFVSAAPSAGAYDPSTGDWTLGPLAAFGSATLQLSATVVDPGALTNVAQRVAGNEMDPVPFNDVSGVTVNGEAADLQVLKGVRTRVPGAATVGERIRYTVWVTNRGPDAATNVRVQDALPAGLTFAGAVASQGIYSPAAGVWEVGALAASGPASLATLTIDADVGAPVPLVNEAARLGADQVDAHRLNDRAAVTITALPADLQLALTSEGTPGAIGSALDLVAALTSVAAGDVSGPVTVTFTIPAEAAFESADAGWGCSLLDQVVSCVRADLIVAQGATATLRIRTRVLASVVGRWVSASVANPLDANPANDTATLALNEPPPASADVQVTLAATPPALAAGDPTALIATVVNAGPGAARATTLALSLPAGFALEAVEPGAAVCTGTGPLSCQLGDLAPGARAPVTVRLRAVDPGRASASAAAATAVDDQDQTNNAATIPLVVDAGGDMDHDQIPDTCEGLFGLVIGQNDATADADGDGVSNLEECLNGTHPRGFHRAYFAEGSAGGDFFDATFAIANRSDASAASVTVRLVREDGSSATRALSIAAGGRTEVGARSLLGEAASSFSALIESDVPFSSERTMTWDVATRYGSHAERGVEQPAARWYLAEGSTTEYELFYMIYNPGSAPATVDVEFLLPGGPSLVRTYTAGADRRTTIWINAVPGVEATDVSAIVTSRDGVPIVVERSMYRSSTDLVWSAGDSSAGVTALATTWHLAEGATGAFFDTFVLIANPNDAAAEIEGRFRRGDGIIVTKAYSVAPRSRFTIWVDAADPALAATDVATTIVSTNGVGVFVERAMWWPGAESAAALGTAVWSEAHVAAASPVTASRWALAEGEQGGPGGAQTYVLIANTSPAGGTVQVTLHFDDGSTLARNLPIAAGARLSVPIGTSFPAAAGRQFAITVESAGGTPLELVVERATYADSAGVPWAAGSAVMGSPMP